MATTTSLIVCLLISAAAATDDSCAVGDCTTPLTPREAAAEGSQLLQTAKQRPSTKMQNTPPEESHESYEVPYKDGLPSRESLFQVSEDAQQQDTANEEGRGQEGMHGDHDELHHHKHIDALERRISNLKEQLKVHGEQKASLKHRVVSMAQKLWAKHQDEEEKVEEKADADSDAENEI
eukprot:gnl/TRDRNA2_/TRDRNA2_163833_c0_seq2.p1 gnl/TRDRNA2_/TRDRNA2_163833_c0~~gnl/TRDRNA2_/TRDRNA2_163833_c0_seq2.p1  ORF type:complete len:179 (-),score=63.67 gnl/TRDRNA2_/TRDRNA2_163833_c0_seq2:442-978(-)